MYVACHAGNLCRVSNPCNGRNLEAPMFTITINGATQPGTYPTQEAAEAAAQLERAKNKHFKIEVVAPKVATPAVPPPSPAPPPAPAAVVEAPPVIVAPEPKPAPKAEPHRASTHTR